MQNRSLQRPEQEELFGGEMEGVEGVE